MSNAFNVLKERGFVQQATDEEAVRKAFDKGPVRCYIGFDPTADSLHIGHLVQIMALAHLQRCGHTPVALVGGGTAMIGDPSGRTELRQMLSREDIEKNLLGLKAQIGRYLDFENGQAMMVNNADWLLDLGYIDFLRDTGRHFSVNRMLAAETYKIRMETGLSFLEFNYQILQAYDFLMLYRNYGVTMQMGGDDQWGNILAGVDLIRRVDGGSAEAVTMRLVTTADGQKMGKTAAGAVWIDPERLSPYDYYQFWINTDDRDVGPFLAYFTFLPMDEIRRLEALEGADIREAKTILAYEATKLTHGEEEAQKARQGAESVFKAQQGTLSALDFDKQSEGLDFIPASGVHHSIADLEAGISAVDLFYKPEFGVSKSEIRRLIPSGGLYINDERVLDIDRQVTREDLRDDNSILIRIGKKRYLRIDIDDNSNHD